MIGWRVADELFADQVKLEFASESDGDHAEMTDRCREVTNLYVANGLLTRDHTREEIFHVVVARNQAFRIGRQLLDQHFWIARFDRTASDKNPAVGPQELYPVLVTVRVDHAAVPGVGIRAPAAVRDTIGVGVLNIVEAGRRKTARNHFDKRLSLHRHRAVAF